MRAPPSDIEPLFHFCRHCGGDYTPQEGGIEGACPECAQHLYTRCNERGATVPAADARHPSSGRTLCRSCATRLCCTCRGCGELHERSSTDFLVDAYGQTVCSSCWGDWDACSECGEYFPADDLEEGEDADEHLCRRCAARRGGRLIHPYSYKPEPIFHRADGEGADALALGIELEMDGGSPEQAARGILALAGSDYLYFKRDSSLEDGAELVTHPVSPAVLLSPEGKELWRSICGAAESAGMRSHDTRTCGLHVHVSRAYFGQSQTAQALAEYKMLALVDRLFEPLAIFSRRRREQLNRWARRPDTPVGNDGWIETARLVHRTARHDRYQAVNIQNEATIELRMFRGTLRPETLFATFATFALVAGMCAVARAMRAESASAAAGFMHNGTLAGLDTSPDVSDSMAYARNVLAPLKGMRGGLSGAAQRRIVEATAQGSRFLLMTGGARVLTFGRWVADGGCLYSNESFRGRGRTGHRGAQASLFDVPGWPAAGAWPPGPFPACGGCPLAGECSDLGPWCGDAEEAEEVSGMAS